MNNDFDMCSCGWIGDNFASHHRETELEDLTHVETSPLMVIAQKN